MRRRTALGVRQVIGRVLADTGISIVDLAWILLPHYGHRQLDTQCLHPLRIPESITLKYAGDQWGHMGPNDQIIGLTHLFARQAVSPGDYVAMLGVGIGMTWTATMLRIDQVPPGMRSMAPPLRWPWRAASASHPTPARTENNPPS